MLRTAMISVVSLAPLMAAAAQDGARQDPGADRRAGLAVHVYGVSESGQPLPRVREGQRPSIKDPAELAGLPPMSLVHVVGFLTVDTAGHYEFEIIGASPMLRIGEVQVIGSGHEGRSFGSVVLQPGEHPLQMSGVSGAEARPLALRWKSPRMPAFGDIPADVLSHDKASLQPPPGAQEVKLSTPHPQATSPVHNTLSDAEKAAGWELLFDGQSMDKWRGFHREDVPAGWQVIDGAITRVGSAGDILTRDQYENFDLYLDWRIAPAGNSGIFYHVRETSDGGERYGAVWQTGPEMQVLDNGSHPDGGRADTAAGANYALHAPIGDATRPIGAFNTARIIVRGDHIQYWLNGIKVVEFDRGSDEFKQLVARSKFASMPGFASYRSGYIALQDHGDLVQFRNIKIRRLE
jgi:hypothetical protein